MWPSYQNQRGSCGSNVSTTSNLSLIRVFSLDITTKEEVNHDGEGNQEARPGQKRENI